MLITRKGQQLTWSDFQMVRQCTGMQYVLQRGIFSKFMHCRCFQFQCVLHKVDSSQHRYTQLLVERLEVKDVITVRAQGGLNPGQVLECQAPSRFTLVAGRSILASQDRTLRRCNSRVAKRLPARLPMQSPQQTSRGRTRAAVPYCSVQPGESCATCAHGLLQRHCPSAF